MSLAVLRCSMAVALLVTFLCGGLSAAVTAKQRSAVNTLKRKIRTAERFTAQERYDEASVAITELIREYDELVEQAREEEDLVRLLEPVYSQLLRTHARLELEGVEVPPLRKPSAPGDSSGGAVSFREHVAPILVAKCGRCHVNSARGMFSMATYADLMRGSEAGKVIFEKDDTGSRLIEVIESGDMPRGGLRITPEELATLKAWIREGARYDGPDPQTPITTFAPDTRGNAPTLEIARPTGQETVSFANDIAPVLAESCAGCHGNGRQNGGQFNLATFEAMLRGGDSGPPLVPRNAEESLIVRKLKGTAGGERMPRGQPPLADEVIAKIATWIDEGAAFDGHDPRANVIEVADLARALRSTHDELSQQRAQLASRNWRLGLPNVDAATNTTKNFLLVGNVGEATLRQYGEQAEDVATRVADLLKVPEDEPLIKGRMTLYVLAGRYDYSEFGKMVEQRELPSQWRGHWRFNVIDAYGAFVPERGGEFSNDVLLGHVIAGTYVASLARDVPRWFAEGAARATAARLEPRDPRVEQWDKQAESVLGTLAEPHDFMAGKLAPEAADLAAYRFVSFVMTRDTRRFRALLQNLRDGQSFENAFLTVYRVPPEQIAPAWARYEATNTRRR